MSNSTLPDTPLTDLGPFFDRYDRRNQRLMVMAMGVSLILSAVIATHLLSTGGPPGLKALGVIWGVGVVFSPPFIAAWWMVGALMALRRRKDSAPDGSHPAGALDAGNGMRIANAGFVFNLALMAAMLLGQVLMALLVFGFGHQIRGDLVARAITLMVGAATIYLGNLWPRMPISRVPGERAASRMKANRFSGWFMVIVGLLVMLWGLVMPIVSHPTIPAPPPFEASRHKEISLPGAQLDRFVGRYDFGPNDFGPNFVIRVTHDGPTLRVLRENSPGAQATPIYPEAPRAFFWKVVEAQLRFTTDASGAVIGAEFRQGDAWQPGERMKP